MHYAVRIKGKDYIYESLENALKKYKKLKTKPGVIELHRIDPLGNNFDTLLKMELGIAKL